MQLTDRSTIFSDVLGDPSNSPGVKSYDLRKTPYIGPVVCLASPWVWGWDLDLAGENCIGGLWDVLANMVRAPKGVFHLSQDGILYIIGTAGNRPGLAGPIY